MFRSVTSDVSALSGIVANGHQTMHLVSPIPSKIPYGGFSPVRLQTRFRPRPPSRAGHCTFIGRHRGDLQSQRLIRSRSCDQSAPRPSDIHRESSGPWLPNRLSCPVGSSLTMATSAPLSATRRLIILSRYALDSPGAIFRANLRSTPGAHKRRGVVFGLRGIKCIPSLFFIPPSCGSHPPTAEGPNFTLPVRSPHAAARTPVVPATACDDTFIAGFAFAELAATRQPQIPPFRNRWVA